MKWPKKVELWLKETGRENKTGDFTLADLYETAHEAMGDEDPKLIIKECKGKYSTFAYDPVVTCPVCEEDRKENEYALALFYTSEIISIAWNRYGPGDDCDELPGVM